MTTAGTAAGNETFETEEMTRLLSETTVAGSVTWTGGESENGTASAVGEDHPCQEDRHQAGTSESANYRLASRACAGAREMAGPLVQGLRPPILPSRRNPIAVVAGTVVEVLRADEATGNAAEAVLLSTNGLIPDSEVDHKMAKVAGAQDLVTATSATSITPIHECAKPPERSASSFPTAIHHATRATPPTAMFGRNSTDRGLSYTSRCQHLP